MASQEGSSVRGRLKRSNSEEGQEAEQRAPDPQRNEGTGPSNRAREEEEVSWGCKRQRTTETQQRAAGRAGWSCMGRNDRYKMCASVVCHLLCWLSFDFAPQVQSPMMKRSLSSPCMSSGQASQGEHASTSCPSVCAVRVKVLFC
jgi:hypothetical protein